MPLAAAQLAEGRKNKFFSSPPFSAVLTMDRILKCQTSFANNWAKTWKKVGTKFSQTSPVKRQ
jgi:hypothetical protein